MRRPGTFSLADAIRLASFTPREADVPALLDLLSSRDKKLVRSAMRALGRVGDAALGAARARLPDAKPPVRGRLATLVGRLVRGREDPVPALAPLLADPDPKTRRRAVIALGKVGGRDAERALVGYLSTEAALPHQAIVAEALGKVGGAQALAALRPIQGALRAVLTIERTVGRAVPSGIDAFAAPAEPLRARFHCRRGIEAILQAELGGAWRPEAVAPGIVETPLAGPLSTALRARTWTEIGFPLPPVEGPAQDAVVQSLCSPAATRVFETFTRGPVRFRLAFAEGGRRRALVWAIATGIARTRPDLVNDPTDSTWEARVSTQGSHVEVELVPKKLEDPRFAYREADVPASSHPTIAAALARVAGVDPAAIVWDPFCGSGLELVERARAGPYRAIHGTDHDARALEAARKNLVAAGVPSATLVQADALGHTVAGATLVLTNPPWGARSEFGVAKDLLLRFVDHAARVLAPGGRLVWISPFPTETATRAERAGLEATFRQALDEGAQMQGFWKPGRPKKNGA